MRARTLLKLKQNCLKNRDFFIHTHIHVMLYTGFIEKAVPMRPAKGLNLKLIGRGKCLTQFLVGRYARSEGGRCQAIIGTAVLSS